MKEDQIALAYIRVKDRLKGTVRRITQRPEDVEDILQDAYINTYCAAKKAEIDNPEAFLAKTARNLTLNHINSYYEKNAQQMGENVEQIVIPDSTQVEDQVASQNRFLDLCIAVRTLPPQCRKVFVLKKVYGYSHKEIALEMNISEKTIEKHITKGIKHCVKYFASLDEEMIKEKSGIANEPRKIRL